MKIKLIIISLLLIANDLFGQELYINTEPASLIPKGTKVISQASNIILSIESRPKILKWGVIKCHFKRIFMIFIYLILITGKAVGIWDTSTIHSQRIHNRFTMELGEIHHN